MADHIHTAGRRLSNIARNVVLTGAPASAAAAADAGSVQSWPSMVRFYSAELFLVGTAPRSWAIYNVVAAGQHSHSPGQVPPKDPSKPKLAIVSTQWRQNSHSEHMGDCFMHGWGLGGVWHEPAVEIVSMCECSYPCLELSVTGWHRCADIDSSTNCRWG